MNGLLRQRIHDRPSGLGEITLPAVGDKTKEH